MTTPAPNLPPVLETPRITLRGHQLGDFEDSAAMWADPQVVKHISGTPLTREAVWGRYLRAIGHWAVLGFGNWTVTSNEDGRFLGEVGFVDFKRDVEPPLGGRPEAGWVFKTDAQGRGYATEAVLRMLSWADANLNAPQTVCIFDPDHTASIRVARKAGYRDEGLATYHDRPTLVMVRDRAL